MMGSGEGEQAGLIPRLCKALFERVVAGGTGGQDGPQDGHEHVDANVAVIASEQTCKVEASYLEIYNEKVFDLLNPSGYALRHMPRMPHMQPLHRRGHTPFLPPAPCSPSCILFLHSNTTFSYSLSLLFFHLSLLVESVDSFQTHLPPIFPNIPPIFPNF